MATRDNANLDLVPSIEIDSDLEAEVEKLLEMDSPMEPWDGSASYHAVQQRPSLQLGRIADQQSRNHTPYAKPPESYPQTTDPTNLLNVKSKKSSLTKRYNARTGTPTSPQEAGTGGFLSAGAPVQRPHSKAKPSKLTVSERQRPVDIHIRPQTSTSQLSGFSLRPISGIGTRPTSSLSIHSSVLAIPDNVRNLMFRAIDRARGIKRRGTPDPLDSPCSSVSDFKVSVVSHGALMKRLDSFYVMKDGESKDHNSARQTLWKWKKFRVPSPFSPCHKKINFNYYIDPHGTVYFVWMIFISLAFLYNALLIPLRAAFIDEVQPSYFLPAWMVFDYAFDILFFLDIILVQSHLSHRDQGVLVNDLTWISVMYYCSWALLIDALAILPTDVLYAIPSLAFSPIIRLNRLLKVRCFKIFLDRLESRTRLPHGFRLIKIVSIFLYIIHLNCCVYYAFSRAQGLGSTTWVYSGNGTSYIRCFYWSLLAVATINDNLPNPTNSKEFGFVTFNYLLGVFVMALFISEMSSIWEAYDLPRLRFRRKWDTIKEFMRKNKIPKELRNRVSAWYTYALSQQSILAEHYALKTLPKKMKADLAIHVHLETLSKVTLFQDCEKTLLRELVLRLKPALFVPNDYICKKGEIGKEMYIVHEGLVAVVGGAEDNEIFDKLGPGSIFGEISLLAVGGGNRRSASVVSKGFSTLFVLSKKDLQETLLDYPEAQESLEKKARYLLHKDRKREDKKNEMGSLTPNAQQLGKNIRSSKMAKLAVSAMANAMKHSKGKPSAEGEEKEEDDMLEKERDALDQSESRHKTSNCSTKGSILSRLLKSNKIAPSPKDSVCSVDTHSDNNTSLVAERFRRALELHQEQLYSLDDPTAHRPRTLSFDESLGTPSIVNSSLSGADRWKMASEALSNGNITLSEIARCPLEDSTIGCDSPSRNAQSLWPRARGVVSTGSGVSSLYADDMSCDFEDLLEDESLL